MKTRRAFTLVELLIVITIVAILSAVLGLSYQRLELQTRFERTKNQIVSMVQKARSLSLSNLLLSDTEEVEYYLLNITSSGVTVEAHASSSEETLASLSLDSDMALTSLQVYYFPPYGEVCFSPDCTDEDPSLFTRLSTLGSADFSSTSDNYEAVFTIDRNGGYVEVN